MTIDTSILNRFFCTEKTLHIAQACGFVKRIRKLDPFHFFLAISFGALKLKSITLNALADELPADLSRIAIHRRFTAEACDFMQAMMTDFMALLKTEGQAIKVEALNYFTAVNIIDSTSWKLPAGLAAAFPGYHTAGCKVQLMFDYLTGTVNLIDIMKQTSTDQNYARILAKQLQTGALYLFDMGYTVADAFVSIDAANAYFLSRFNPYGLNLYRETSDGFDIIELVDEIQHLNKLKIGLDWNVWVGNKTHKTKVRLILTRMPEEIANRRRQAAKLKASKKGEKPSQKALCLCDWGLWITNIPQSFHNLSIPQLLALYPLRWSIELFFKQLKSTLNIEDTTVLTNQHRLTCEVIGCCIVTLFITFCYSCARAHAWRKMEKEVSFDKTVKHFHRHIAPLVEILYNHCNSPERLYPYMIQHLQGILQYCLKGRQKSRTNSLDQVVQPSRYLDYHFFSVPIGLTPLRTRELGKSA